MSLKPMISLDFKYCCRTWSKLIFIALNYPAILFGYCLGISIVLWFVFYALPWFITGEKWNSLANSIVSIPPDMWGGVKYYVFGIEKTFWEEYGKSILAAIIIFGVMAFGYIIQFKDRRQVVTVTPSQIVFKGCGCPGGNTCNSCACIRNNQLCTAECRCKGLCKSKLNTEPLIAKPIETYDVATDILDRPCISVFIGLMDSGKTTTTKSLMFEFNRRAKFHFGLCITGTKNSHEYDYLGDTNIWPKYDHDQFMGYIDILQRNMDNKIPPNFIFFDDLLGQIPNFNATFKAWVSIFRKTNTWLFISVQALSDGISPLLRDNARFVFMFRATSDTYKDGLAAYFRNYCTKPEFKQLLQSVTDQEYHCLLFLTKQVKRSTVYRDYIATVTSDTDFYFIDENYVKNIDEHDKWQLQADARLEQLNIDDRSLNLEPEPAEPDDSGSDGEPIEAKQRSRPRARLLIENNLDRSPSNKRN